MSTNTSVLVGVYMVCEMSQAETLDNDPSPTCSKNAKHRVGYDDKFCPRCGAVIDRAPKKVMSHISLHDMLNGNVENPQLDDMPAKALLAHLDPIQGEWVGYRGKKGTELVGFNMVRIEADNEGVHSVDEMEHGFDRPTQEQIDLLKELVGYTSVVVKYGVLVEVA